MRALVKCISLFGLGIGLYLGDLKHVVQHTDFEKAQQFIDVNDYMGLHQFIKGLSEKDQIELFNNAPSGQKTKFKESHPNDHEAGRGLSHLGRGGDWGGRVPV